MGLADIRNKNKNKSSFVNATIDYNLSSNTIEIIKDDVFKKVVRPINNNSLAKIKY